MSLSKLLAAGKSIMGVKDGNSPYRMNARNLLPKFVSTKNPLGTSKPASTSAQPGLPEMETVSLFDHAAGTNDSASQKVEAPRAPVAASTVAARPGAVAACQTTPAPENGIHGKPGALGKWVRSLNPLAYLAGGQPNPVAGKSRAARSSVQGEFSLENVKVVRNPLNDSDLEVVPAKPVIVRDPTLKESPASDTTLRGAPVRDVLVPDAAVFSPVEAGGFGAGVLDVGNAR